MTAKKTKVVKPKMKIVRADLITSKVDAKEFTTLAALKTYVEAAITTYGEDKKVACARLLAVLYQRPETERECARRLKEEAAEKARKEKAKAAKSKRDLQNIYKLAKRLKMEVTPIQIQEPVKAPNYTE